MAQLTLDSVVLVPVISIRLSLHPFLSGHDVLCLALSRIDLSLGMFELSELHVFNTFTGKSHILRFRKSEGARDEFLHHGFLSRESVLSYVRQTLLHQIFNKLLADGRSRCWLLCIRFLFLGHTIGRMAVL